MISFLLGFGVGSALAALVYHFYPSERSLVPPKYLWALSVTCMLAALVIYLLD